MESIAFFHYDSLHAYIFAFLCKAHEGIPFRRHSAIAGGHSGFPGRAVPGGTGSFRPTMFGKTPNRGGLGPAEIRGFLFFRSGIAVDSGLGMAVGLKSGLRPGSRPGTGMAAL